MNTLTIFRVASLTAILFTLVVKTSFSYTPLSWPTSGYLAYKYQNGSYIQDPVGDENPDDIDIVYSQGYPSSVYWQGSNNSYFFRLQVKGNPTHNSGLSQYRWQVYFATSSGPVAVAGIDGLADKVYVQGINANCPTFVFSNTMDGIRIISNPSPDNTYFVEFQVPLAAMTAASNNAINATTTIQYFYATSTNMNNINKDFMSFNGLPPAGVTLQNGGIFNGLENVNFSGPLPVELESFSARSRDEGGVILTWKTISEKNNYGFEVERSSNRIDWTSLGFVLGHGTVNTPQTYIYVDDQILSSVGVYYRLRQIDRDGTTENSPTIGVRLEHSSMNIPTMENYPNPFNPSTTISISLQSVSPVNLKVLDASGKIVRILSDGELLSEGIHSFQFHADALPSGVYFAILSTTAGTTSKAIVLNK